MPPQPAQLAKAVAELLAPPVAACRAGAGRVLPFRLGWQTISTAGTARQPGNEGLRVIPTDIVDRRAIQRHRHARRWSASAIGAAGVPLRDRHRILAERESPQRHLVRRQGTGILRALAHHEAAGGDTDHPDAGRAILEFAIVAGSRRHSDRRHDHGKVPPRRRRHWFGRRHDRLQGGDLVGWLRFLSHRRRCRSRSGGR